MSIKGRMEEYKVLRVSDVLDAYGYKSANPTQIIGNQLVSITKSTFGVGPTHPLYTEYEYVGISQQNTVEEGDLLQHNSGITYIVKAVSNSSSSYHVLFLNLWQK